MKIYTKTGDDGETGLLGGDRIAKTNPRIAAIGAVDALNAQLGLALCELLPAEVRQMLSQCQNHLFDLGSMLAAPDPAKYNLTWNSELVRPLEEQIDTFSDELPPLKNFILPGGSRSAALLHVARSDCREAERAVLSIPKEELVNANLAIYLNRLSDWLFTAARLVNFRSGVQETIWSKTR